MSISMKLLVENTSQEQFLWIWNQVPWIPLELVLSVNYLDLIILFSDKLELVTTGLKDIIPKELNSLTVSSMLSEKKLKVVIASKVSKSLTHWEEVLVPVWELS